MLRAVMSEQSYSAVVSIQCQVYRVYMYIVAVVRINHRRKKSRHNSHQNSKNPWQKGKGIYVRPMPASHLISSAAPLSDKEAPIYRIYIVNSSTLSCTSGATPRSTLLGPAKGAESAMRIESTSGSGPDAVDAIHNQLCAV